MNNSLSNLNTEYLDLLLLHRPSPLMNTDIISDAVNELIKKGKIKDFGVSNFKPSHIELLSKNIKISWNQIEFSISNSSPMLDGTIDFHQINDIGTMAWSPLGNFFKIDSPENQRIKKIFESLNEKYDTNSENLLLAWILKHPSRIHPIIGTTINDRVENACNSLKINLDIEDWFSIFEAQKGERSTLKEMKEKIILITGASSGIGKATAEILGGGKNKLIICGRRKDRLEKLRSQIDGEVHILNFDVRDKKSVFDSISSIPRQS